MLVSGDEDFIPAARGAKAGGKGVEVASFKSNLSPHWGLVPDHIWILDSIAQQISR